MVSLTKSLFALLPRIPTIKKMMNLCEDIGKEICKATPDSQVCKQLAAGLVQACKASASVGRANCAVAINPSMEFLQTDQACKAVLSGVEPSVEAMANSVGLSMLTAPIMDDLGKSCTATQQAALARMGDVAQMSPEKICKAMEKELVAAATSDVAKRFATGIQKRVTDSAASVEKSVKREANKAADKIKKESNKAKKAINKAFGGGSKKHKKHKK